MKYLQSYILQLRSSFGHVCGRKHDRKRACFIVRFTLFWFALFLLPYYRLNLSRF